MSAPDASLVTCPNCRQAMQGQAFERHDHGQVRVDICFDCGVIWFDRLESVQLAPAGVIDLFKGIAARKGAVRQALAPSLNCPRCSDPLHLSHDLCKTGRFSYFACPRGEGRLTPFVQFLREKQFVRTLTGAELQRVRAQVRQISCSECGAPIDLEHDTVCSYCHAPVSFLDPETVEKAMRLWTEADARRHLQPNLDRVASALLWPPSHATPHPATSPLGARLTLPASARVDLVALGIDIVASLFDRSS